MLLDPLYRHSLALLTDLYQLTMAYGYWKLGRAEESAAYHWFFRQHPFGGGYTIACGLQTAVELIERFRFTDDDVEYLAGIRGNDGRPLFDRGFLDYLRQLELSVDVDAAPEGTVVFPHEPLLRVTGPITECQLLETPLLCVLNFQTLIATKAARVCAATGGDPVLEFGLRRAQGIDGSLSASRAAHIGGCESTSNVLAGKLLGIPVRGTHAHSWVMSYDDQRESFEQYARAMPNNCVFLVDTYDTLQGVRHAVDVGRQLREQGHRMVGIRLDSGDLAYLSIEARRILDEAGLTDAVIVASNDLDEHIIHSLKDQGAKIAVWGVGTKMVTAYDQPALGGVYKLTALRQGDGPWQHKLKLSEQAIKVSTPGLLQVRRFRGTDGYEGDMVFDELLGVTEPVRIVDPLDPTRGKRLTDGTQSEDLLQPVMRQGQPCSELPPLADIRRRTQQSLAGFHAGIRRVMNPHEYPVGLEQTLHALKTDLIVQARQRTGASSNP